MQPDRPEEQAPPCDGSRLLDALAAAARWLEAHRTSVDALNVFPVPDGDTGTNMSLTLNAALREAQDAPVGDVTTIAERAAYGALMGARGNSGVILSQLLRGFARAVQGQPRIEPATLAEALAAAAETAGRAVMKPVEGTILTVSAATAGAAAEAAAVGQDLPGVLAAALDEARAAVARTPAQLPILQEAGVVDAGAQGYLLILEGAMRYLQGLPTSVEAGADAAAETLHFAHVEHEDEYGYCTEFVVVGPRLDAGSIRETIGAMGASTIVVGDEGIVRVHVHTEDPGRVLSYVAPLGQLHKIKIDNMQDQHNRFVTQAAAAEAVPQSPPPAPAAENHAAQGLVGVVAVAPGEGLARVFRSLGAGAVVPGGQTMNPSTQELLAAVDALPQGAVLVLPNNGNVLLAAGQAAELSAKAVQVVPARTAPQGIAALLAYTPDADLETNGAAMAEAAAGVHTGEVTLAVRDAQVDGLAVRAGQALGLLDDRAVLAGDDRDAVALDLLERMGAPTAEVLTVYYGRDVPERAAQGLAARARERYEGLDVEVVEGGQPHYPYIMSIE